jgi:hypothetical protein
LTIDVQCDSNGNAEDALKMVSIDSTNTCQPKIVVSHVKACPVFSATTFSRFLVERPYILGPIAIVFGLIVTFAGRKFFPWTIGIMGCAIGFGITMLLISMFDMLNSH